MGVTTRGYYTMLLKYRDVLIHHFGLPNRYRYCSFKYRPILKSTDAGKHGPDFREKKDLWVWLTKWHSARWQWPMLTLYTLYYITITLLRCKCEQRSLIYKCYYSNWGSYLKKLKTITHPSKSTNSHWPHSYFQHRHRSVFFQSAHP